MGILGFKFKAEKKEQAIRILKNPLDWEWKEKRKLVKKYLLKDPLNNIDEEIAKLIVKFNSELISSNLSKNLKDEWIEFKNKLVKTIQKLEEKFEGRRIFLKKAVVAGVALTGADLLLKLLGVKSAFAADAQKGCWFIVDDFLHLNVPRETAIFKAFKYSDFLKEIISAKAEKNHFRLDLFEGINIRRLPSNYVFANKSGNVYGADIISLLDLENDENTNNRWELHLFLNRTTSQSMDIKTINKIAIKLNQLRVEKIVVWEFCPRKPSEITQYKKFFSYVAQKGQIQLEHHLIYSEAQFREVAAYF